MSEDNLNGKVVSTPDQPFPRPSLWQRISKSPYLGMYCALFSAIGSPLHLLTAAMISNVGAPMILLIRSLEHVAVFSIMVACTCRNWSEVYVRSEAFYVMGHALTAAFSLLTVYFALAYLPSGDVYVISCATPIFATLGGYLFLKEKFGIIQGVSAITVAIGAVIITKPSWIFGEVYAAEGAWIGTLLAISSCVFTTMQALMVRKLQKTSTGVVVVVAALALALISAALLLLTKDYRYPACGADNMLLLAGGAVQILTNGLIVLAGKLVKAGRLSVIKTSSVLFTYVFQVLLIGVVPTWHSILGATLILCSVLMTTFKKCGFFKCCMNSRQETNETEPCERKLTSEVKVDKENTRTEEECAVSFLRTTDL